MTDYSDLTVAFVQRHPDAAAAVLESQAPEAAAALLGALPGRLAAPVLTHMLAFYGARCLQCLDDDTASVLLAAMPVSGAAALLRRLGHQRRNALLESLPAKAAYALRLVSAYPAATVGAWMNTQAPVLPEDLTVGDAWDSLRRQGAELDRTLFVVDRRHRLRGQVRTAALLGAESTLTLGRLAQPAPDPLSARDTLVAVGDKRAWETGDPLPVITREQALAGALHLADLRRGLAALSASRSHPRSGTASGALGLVELCWQLMGRALDASFKAAAPDPGDDREHRYR